MTPNPPQRKIVYDGTFWEIERVDAGMGEHDYNILLNGAFFACTEHLETAMVIIKALEKYDRW